MTGHIHADSMKQYAEDAATHKKPWELWEFTSPNYNWCTLEKHPEWKEDHLYRRKPRTININGFEVPEPMKNRPEKDCIYYVLGIGDEETVSEIEWADYDCENRWLEQGLCHTTREAAETHAKALLSFTQKNGESNE